MTMRKAALAMVLACAAACGARGEKTGTQGQSATAISANGAIPSGLPQHMMVGLASDPGDTWMSSSGVPWDARYHYFTKGWVCNWGWDSSCSGSWGLNWMNECASQGTIASVAFYEMNGEPGGGESAFLSKVQTPSTMADYFNDVKVLMHIAKQYGKPVLVIVEPDGWGFLEQQSGGNPNKYAAIAASGVPELAGLPNTVAGWGLAFLQLRKALGADNVILTTHVSAWADGSDIAYFTVTDALGPHVDTVYSFLAPMGLAPNQTGSTYDLVSVDPLDRDSDYYVLTQNQDRWWDPSDTASIYSKSFNRYSAWLQAWNAKADKRIVLWQVPIGNSNHLDVCNNGSARQGYKDNRAEYFFASVSSNDTHHLQSFAQDGVIGLLFGAGAACQSSYKNDTYPDGQLFMKSRVGAFYKNGGLPLGGASTTSDAGASDSGTTASPTFSTTASASPATLAPGQQTTITATVIDTSGSLTGGIVDLEVHDSTGAKVAQQYVSNQSFSAGQSQPYSWNWTAPSTSGTYTIEIGVFGSSWSPMYAWHGSAGTMNVAATDPAQYGFETGTQGWVSSGGMITGVASSPAQAYAGTHSLALAVNGSGTQSAFVSSPATPAGATVTFHVWIPSNSNVSWIQPYVQQGSAGGWKWTGNWQSVSSLKTGAWNTLTVVVPSNAATPLYQVGVQVDVGSAWTGTVYVDSIGW